MYLLNQTQDSKFCLSVGQLIVEKFNSVNSSLLFRSSYLKDRMQTSYHPGPSLERLLFLLMSA